MGCAAPQSDCQARFAGYRIQRRSLEMARHEILGRRCEKLPERHRLYGIGFPEHDPNLTLNNRHRLYGTDCPIADFDLTVTEYDTEEPIALVEYKHASPEWGMSFVESVNIRVTRKVADRAKLPFWVSVYRPEDWRYALTPQNRLARELLAWGHNLPMTEQEYVAFLWSLRGRVAPDSFLVQFSNVGPSAAETWRAAER